LFEISLFYFCNASTKYPFTNNYKITHVHIEHVDLLE